MTKPSIETPEPYQRFQGDLTKAGHLPEKKSSEVSCLGPNLLSTHSELGRSPSSSMFQKYSQLPANSRCLQLLRPKIRARDFKVLPPLMPSAHIRETLHQLPHESRAPSPELQALHWGVF